MRPNLLSWQFQLYADNHTRRTTLVVHILTVPLFMSGTGLLLGSWASWALAPAGLACMAVAMALQGRTHRTEPVAPVPFEGPVDVVSRIFLEQWVTFPRFVLSGGFARAWRASTPSSAA